MFKNNRQFKIKGFNYNREFVKIYLNFINFAMCILKLSG